MFLRQHMLPPRQCLQLVRRTRLPSFGTQTQTFRPLSSSALSHNSQNPYGVPAFPVVQPKRTRPLPTYGDIRPKTTRNLIVFVSICGAWVVAAMIALNYERFASPVTASTLHEVRKSPQAKALLGSDIQHKCIHPEYKGWYKYDGWLRQPWITGSINLTKGKIDIAYDVKGTGSPIEVPFDR